MSTVVVIPTLNEIHGVKVIMPQVKKEWAEEFVFVDGGSTDGTMEEAKRMGFKVIHQKTRGVGNAYRIGVEATKSDYILFFSPDGNDEPQEIPKLIQKIKEGYDIVHISRFSKNSINKDAGPVTGFGNRMFTFLVNVFFGGHLTDALTGYIILRREVMLALKTDGQRETTEQQICIRALKTGRTIIEIGGNEPQRTGGQRKMRPLFTGSQLSAQIIKEFIFWQF